MLNAMAELILLTNLNPMKKRSFYIKPNSKQCKQIWNFLTGMDCVPQMLIHFSLYPKYSREQIFNYHVTKTIFLPSICLRWGSAEFDISKILRQFHHASQLTTAFAHMENEGE